MSEETRCESKVAVPVKDEHGKKLPDEWKQCEHEAIYLVERRFSGLPSVLCGGHIRWYRKLEKRGQVSITSLKAEA